MTDRYKFIHDTAVEFFGARTVEHAEVIRDFLENDDVTILAAVSLDGEVLFQNAVPVEEQYCLLFYKIPNLDYHSPNSAPKIGMLTLEGGLAKSIYNSLQRVFSPYILKKCEYSTEVKTILQNLHSNLGLSLGLTESGILSIQDEINFWAQKTRTLPTKADREAAKSFAAILAKINDQLKDSQPANLNQLDDFIGVCQTHLDDMWHLPHHYPQNRMCSIFDLISTHVVTTCTEYLTEQDIWDAGSIYLDEAINHVKETLESWYQTYDSLTRLFWPNYDQHAWIGEPYNSKQLNKFRNRYSEVLAIKNCKDLLYALFFDNDEYSLHINEIIGPFRDINIYDLTPLGNKRWEVAKSRMETSLAKVDENVVFILKRHIHDSIDNSRQMIHVFNRYKEIFNRPSILKALTVEREQLYQNVPTIIRELREMLTTATHTDGDVTPIVSETRWYQAVEAQISQLEAVAQTVLVDRDDFDEVIKKISTFKEEVQAMIRANFETWTENSLGAIRDGELSLRENQPVVIFDKTERQLMKVTFGPKIVTFYDEARHLHNLGLKLDPEIQKSITHSMKFISYARRLQQIALFHNTIGDRMIPCQRPIMLKNAMEFSKLVKSELVSWNDEDSVERYINSLQEAVKRLSKDNNQLTAYHEQAKKSILKLMNTDLIRQSNIWKDEMRMLREIIFNLEKQGYTNLNPFKLHWDHQLYKVLEHQYVAGLINVHQKLPDIHLDLVFRQHQIQFRPSLEEIKSKYYSQLRRFVEKPLGFKGLSEQSSIIFKAMIERNATSFSVLYEKAEIVFRELAEFRDSWLPWVSLGMVDLEQLCTVHCTAWQHWDNNFRACKKFSQQIARIQQSEKEIDCLIINYAPLCSDLDAISRRYWDALASTLRTSILDNISTLQEYLTYSFQVLQNIPQDEWGISESSAKYEKIVSDLPKMTDLMKSLQGKDNCLAGWCKERLSALNGVLLQWNQLQPLIENHQTLLQGRLDIIKENILRQINELNDEAEKFSIRWESTIRDLETNDNADMSLFRERQSQWKGIISKRETLLKQTEKFNIKVPEEFDAIFTKLETDISEQGKNWELFNDFLTDYETVATEEWTIYRRRPHILTDFLTKWEKSLSPVPASVASSRISSILERYKSSLPVLNALQSDALIEKHWAKLCQMLKIDSKSQHDLCLGDVLAVSDHLQQQAAEVQSIVRQAASEHVIRQAIVELEQWAATAMLKLIQHTDSKGATVSLIKDFTETLNKIGDNQFLLQSAKNSTSFESFSDQADVWEEKLNNLDYIISHLNQVQKKWIYLEPVFGVGTLKREEAVFKSIDKNFRYIMKEIADDPKVVSVNKINNVLSIIETLQNQISRCQNALSSFITTKRNAFSRFYFLSDDDLLEMLGQSTKEAIIQKHIRKLFPGIYRLVIDDSGSKITAFCSEEGDQLQLMNSISISPVIEDWLNVLVTEIKNALQLLIKKCLEKDFFEEGVIREFPMQVICLVNSINFTRRTEKAISGMQLADLKRQIQSDINRYSVLLHKSTDQLTKIKLRALLIDLVYQTTTIDYLSNHNVTNLQDWYWLQQLKFYVDRNGIVQVKMVYAEFEYSYEFLGNYSKLVYTSLAHNCYLILTQAMQLGLGGNPFGPAGTGKTECVKSLGAMLGRLVLVFNCDENIDTTAMALILSGLARCGAWGCFDEFNRLQEATLSAISMLIQPLQVALKDKQSEVLLNNETVPLNKHCCVFVTLNPAGEEYGGRQQLPLNLQALFRPIAMQAPRPQQIARVTLFVEGFKHADRLGGQIVELFELSKKMLSKQRHYDWGLRELKSILSACGCALTNAQDELTYEEEAGLAVNVIRSNTMSRLTLFDYKRFDVLLSNVFPNIGVVSNSDDDLRSKIVEAFTALGFQQNNRQIDKCLELAAQLQKRMGVVVIGPPRSGKSTIISVLKEALMSRGSTIRAHIISPKSMNRVQLLGKLDPDTRQWNDGVLTSTAVAVNAEPRNVTSWIICDGDIDPEWIEALNSVLDDNRLLTLPSGWRIQFGSNVNFIFETHDLSRASPATISRMGIINLNAEDLPYQLVVNAWLAKQADRDILKSFLDQYYYRAIDWIEEQKRRPFGFSLVSLAEAGLTTLESVHSTEQFCIDLLGGLNGVLTSEGKNKLSNQLFSWADITVTDSSVAEFHYYNSFRNMVDLYSTDEITGAFVSESIYTNVLVKTPLVKQNGELLKHIICSKSRHVALLAGPSGNGKSLLLQTIVSEFNGYQLVTISCSSQLTTGSILNTLKQNSIVLTTVKGKEYRPKFSKIILYFKNIDLCSVDRWGTCEVIELLLQLVNRSGFYSETLEWISVAGVIVCASVSDIRKTHLSPRFLSICALVQFGYPNQSDLESIVKSMILPVYNQLGKNSVKIRLNDLVRAVMNVYFETQARFNRGEILHYRFTPKMIERWISGILYYPVDSFGQALRYECNRIFRDRLVSEEHRQAFDEIVRDNLRSVLPEQEQRSVFGPKEGHKNADMELLDGDGWTETVKQTISMCNAEVISIDIPLTEIFTDVVAAIVRVLSRPQSNLILCGKAGSCRLEALYTAATMLNVKVVFPQTSKGYALNEFNNDLKIAMQNCALENEPIAFYIDHSLIDYMGDIIKTCEAILEGADLTDFFGDDLENLANPLKVQAALESFQMSLPAYFLHRLKQNFHLIILLEHSSPKMHELFENYSALYQKSEVIWILENKITPVSSLTRYLNEIGGSGSPDVKIPVPVFFKDLLDSDISSWSRSPKRRIQLIRTYWQVYQNQKTEKELYRQQIQNGVDKLSETHKVVEKLKLEAQEKQKALAEKRKLANQSLEMISTTMRGANDQKTELLELQRKTKESSVKLMERKKAIEEELSLVEPVLREASAAVGQIKSEALSEIRSLRAPPETVRDILEGVLRLMGIRDTSWNSMKTFLAKRGVKEDIRSLDPVRISPENCQAVEKLLQTKADSYDQKNAKRASAAAAPLAAWVIANVKYSRVIQSIKPLEREQNELRENLERAESEMKSLSSGLDNVNDTVKGLSEQLNVYTQEAAMLEIKLDDAKQTLHAAEVLVHSLSSEYVSWSKELEELNQTVACIDKRSFMTAYCITYLSHLSLETRRNALQNASKQTNEQLFDMDDLVSNQDKIIWESMGLGADQQYRENAIILNQFMTLPFGTTPIPLLVDPTELGQKWLVNYLNYLNRTFEITSQSADRFGYILELAIRFGKILIIRSVNAIEPPLLSLFFTRIHVRFNKRMVQISNKLIDLHDDFKLILITQNERLQLGPELQAYFMNLMFTTTTAGLTDVLTFNWVLAKNPEIEKKRVDLLEQEGRLVKEKRGLQDKLLQELSASKGGILKNEPLLNTLNSIKTSASSIEKSLEEFSSIRDQLMEHYSRRKELCSLASRFYMGIHRLYAINVAKFTSIFLAVIETEAHSNTAELYKNLVRRIFGLLSRGIPKDEQMILGLNICKHAFPDLLPEKEWESFVFNFTNAEQTGDQPLPITWIKSEHLPKVQSLKHQHPELYSKLNLDNVSIWVKYVESDEATVPVSVSDFQSILVAQVIRPDLLIRTITRSVQNILGLKSLHSVRPSVKLLSEESFAEEPLLLITASGIDPSEEIREFAKQTIGLSKYGEFAVSKGNEVEALKLIKEAANAGGWVCLKNIHTVPQWIRHLDETLKSLNFTDGFRLWLTSETDKNLNDTFVKKCNKVLFEPPTGLKYKMKLLLDQHSGAVTRKRDYRSIKMYVGLFLLHSILQERRSYIPQGWTKWHDFSDSDLRTAMQLIRYTEGSNTLKIQWPLIQGLCEKVGYGGRIDNENDFEKLEHLLREFFDERIMTSRWQPMFMNVSFPNSNHLEDYVKVVDQLPEADTPTLYGIPISTNASRDVLFCRNTLKELRQMYFSSSNAQNYEKRFKPIFNLWNKLMNGTITQRLDGIIERQKNNDSPWMIFALSELTIISNLYEAINGSLSTIRNSLKEVGTISGTERSLLTTICDNQVPLQWRRIWSGPKTVIEYLKAIGFKTKQTELFYNNLIEEKPVEEISFNYLFNIEGFLTTIKMIKSQKLKVSTTELKLCAYFDGRKREDAVTVAPLLIDGGILTNGKIMIQQGAHQQSSGPAYTGTFCLDFTPAGGNGERSGSDSKTRDDKFAIPLYSHISREALICQIAVDVGHGLSKSQLVAAGIAFIVPESY
ncbi:cytoplasmic dynein 2 heavy chain 1 [Sabethes cyaneus]|uniref:cytoplasmic dynein 2 heavy chain 1 n=1 Tax=Sabethes cyaneus TaxID=53552 RepID=UPI00237D5C45|nr:cytoplasmic dynein 2 heavy chain 1 [Sabethes cyaneus]